MHLCKEMAMKEHVAEDTSMMRYIPEDPFVELHLILGIDSITSDLYEVSTKKSKSLQHLQHTKVAFQLWSIDHLMRVIQQTWH